MGAVAHDVDFRRLDAVFVKPLPHGDAGGIAAVPLDGRRGDGMDGIGRDAPFYQRRGAEIGVGLVVDQ